MIMVIMIIIITTMTVAKTITNGDEPSDSGATEIVTCHTYRNKYTHLDLSQFDNKLAILNVFNAMRGISYLELLAHGVPV